MEIIDKAVASSVPVIPWPIVHKVAGRYIAGERLEKAIETVRNLNEQGCLVSMDILGEGAQSKRDATEKLEQYKQVIDALEAHDLKSGISVKLTGLGLTLDEEQCRETSRRLSSTRERRTVSCGWTWRAHPTRPHPRAGA